MGLTRRLRRASLWQLLAWLLLPLLVVVTAVELWMKIGRASCRERV